MISRFGYFRKKSNFAEDKKPTYTITIKRNENRI